MIDNCIQMSRYFDVNGSEEIVDDKQLTARSRILSIITPYNRFNECGNR